MRRKTVLRIVHICLFVGFAVAAGGAVWSWQSTGELEGIVVGATIAAFIATASAFVERIFPRDD